MLCVSEPRALGSQHDIAMGFSEDRAQGKFGPYYLLVAENPYVLWDASEHWKSAWRAAGGGTARVQTFTAPQVDFDQLLGAGATVPMFETIQPVMIRDVGKFNGKKQDEFLRIIKQSSASTKWLLTSEDIDKRTSFYKALAGLGPVEVFPKIYPDKIGGWVQRIAGDFEAALSPSAVELIASVHGSDFFGVRQTVERATLYIGRKRRIEVADVEIVLAGEGEYDVFQLLEAASRSDFARSLSIAKALAAASDIRYDASIWLGMIHGQCQRFLQLVGLADKRDDQIAQIMHLHPFLISKLRSQATGFGYDGLVHAVQAAFETDWLIKTSTLPAHTAWELFVWRISQGKKRLAAPLYDLEFPRVRE
jgi:DNA polymerase-3 subunit delta